MRESIRIVMASVLLVTSSVAAQEPLEFSGLQWHARGDWKLAEHLGRSAVLIRNGILDLDEVVFDNGVIEFDVAVAGHRSFMGVAFRLQEGGSYEDFYLRPHQSGRFDALQYTPVWHNASAWQLYPEYNAESLIPRDRWLHVKVVVSDHQLTAYLGDAEQPALEVERMRGPDAKGALALRSFFPEAAHAPGFYPNAFSNFRVTPGEPHRKRPPETALADPGVITLWALSQSFPGHKEQIEAYPADLLERASWRSIETEPSGRVNLAVPEGIAEDQDLGLKLARVTLTSDKARDIRLDYGFSDRISVFLNGRLVFTGDNTYRSRSQRYLGVMTRENDSLFLELDAGENELLMAVTEAFGGWGLTARMVNANGVTSSAGPTR